MASLPTLPVFLFCRRTIMRGIIVPTFEQVVRAENVTLDPLAEEAVRE
jgi:hypothetical protein